MPQAWGELEAARPRGEEALEARASGSSRPNAADAGGAPPLGGEGAPWKSWEKATQWNCQKGRRLVTATATTIPPSHRQQQHRLHHLSDILEFYPGCRKA